MPTRTETAISLFILLAVLVCCYAIYRIDNQPALFDNCETTSYDSATLICTIGNDRYFIKQAPSISDKQLPVRSALQGTLQVPQK